MMGGSVRRKALGFEDEPASTTSKRGVDGNKKSAIMGGSLGRKRRGEKGKGAEAGPEVL